MADTNTSLGQFHSEPTPDVLLDELDYSYGLSDSNADRSCDVCGEPADYYVRDSTRKNGFYCEDDLPT